MKRKYHLTKEKPNKREEILQAAVKVMCYSGYDGTTIDKIAVEAKVSRPLVAKHFGAKEEIAGLYIRRISDNIITKVRRIAYYWEQTDRMFSFVQSSQNELRLLISLFATPALRHIVRNAMPELVSDMEQLVGRYNTGLPEGDVAAWAAVLEHYLKSEKI